MPPRLPDQPAFDALALRHGSQWALTRRGDTRGRSLYEGTHRRSGLQVSTDDLDLFDVLLRIEPTVSRVRPYVLEHERRQRAEERAMLAELTRIAEGVR